MSETHPSNKPKVSEEDRETLFRLLTEEIKDLNDAERLRGWTPWIVSATLISMAWLVVEDLWTRQPSIAPIRATFLAVSLALWLIRIIAVLLESLSPVERGDKRFLLFHTTRSTLREVFNSMWAIGLAIAIWTTNDVETVYIRIALGLFLGFFSLAGVFAVAIIITRLPVPISKKSAPRLTIAFGVVLLTIYALAIVDILAGDSFKAAGALDIRSGGLIAVGAYALLELSHRGGQPVLRNILVGLRRDLVLGSLPVEEVQHHIRTTLQGVWLSDVVRDDLRSLLKLISDVRVLYDDAFRKIDILRASVPIADSSGGQLKDFEKLAVSNTLDVLKTFEPQVGKISEEYFAKLRSLRTRMELVARMVKGTSSEKEKVMSEIKLAQYHADAAMDRFVREFYDIQNAWNLWYPTEARNHRPFEVPAED
jgi:hypothetical protein